MGKNLKQCLVVLLTLILSITITSPISAAQSARERTRKRNIAEMDIFWHDNSHKYMGKSIKPRFNVTTEEDEIVDNGDGTVTATTYFIILTENKDYTVTYKDNNKIGTASLVIKGKGKYYGSQKATFKITPADVKFKNITKGKKKLKVQTTTVKGSCKYQIAYKQTKTSKWKYVSSAKNNITISKLSSKKTYDLKTRAYKKVKDKNGKVKIYYGTWSKTQKVKVR